MARRRKTQWIDGLVTSNVAVAGAAAPGTVVDTTMLAEAELENIGGGGTLIRVVGDLIFRRTAGAPVVTAVLFVAQNYVGAVNPTDWDVDAFQREENLGSWMSAGMDTTLSWDRHHIDLRTKRKLTQGVTVQLAVQNHSVAANDLNFNCHFRFLILLP